MEVCLMGSVFSKHEVRKQGRVLPIVDCPGDSCGFRGSCVLDGWEDDTVRDEGRIRLSRQARVEAEVARSKKDTYGKHRTTGFTE